MTITTINLYTQLLLDADVVKLNLLIWRLVDKLGDEGLENALCHGNQNILHQGDKCDQPYFNEIAKIIDYCLGLSLPLERGCGSGGWIQKILQIGPERNPPII